MMVTLCYLDVFVNEFIFTLNVEYFGVNFLCFFK